MLQIRRAKAATDYERVAELLIPINVEPITANGLIEEDEFMLPGKIRARWVAVDENEVIWGYGMLVKYPSQPPDLFHMELVVDPTKRGQGIGGQIFGEVARLALENGCGRLMSEILDDDAAARGFAEKLGFIISHHVFDSKLDVTTFDESQFAGVIEAVEAQGIRFTTLAAEGDAETARQKLYTLNRMAVLDEPGSVGTFPTYENWCKILLGSSDYRAESQFLAVDGENYVGLAAVFNEPETPTEMTAGLTGVEKAYRGRHIALALKLLAIRYAREHGGKTIVTGNDARNAPMLAINRKLGFQALSERYVIQKNY